MSDHHDSQSATAHSEPDPADSRADLYAAFALVVIAVTAVLYFVAGV